MDHSEQIARGAVLLTVNQRLARHQLTRYQSWHLLQGSTWWDTPSILPMRAWLKSLHEQALATGLSTLTLLPDLLQHKAWRRCIDQDSSHALLDVEAATRGARQAWQLSCAWQCYNDDEQYLSLDQFTWQRWRTRYREFLDAGDLIDEASLPDHLVDVLLQTGGDVLLPDHLILDGFLQLPPQLQMLVDTIRQAGVQVDSLPRNADAHVHCVQYADDMQELLSIATHMRHELDENPNQSLGLVVPDLQQRRSEVLRAFDRVFFPSCSPDEVSRLGRPYDMSLGLPLSDIPVVRTALLMLRLCTTVVEGTELSALLLSPYVLASVSEARRREQMDRELRENRVRSLDLPQLLDALYSGSRLTPAIKRLLRLRKLETATLSEWARRFSDWLKLLGWPGESIDSEEYQAVSSWMECLDDLQLLDENEKTSAGFAITTLQRLVRERVFQLDTPNTPIQIMGRLESHGISFDCLWVAGLDTEQWPAVGSPSPYLSIPNQKVQGVPDASATARLALAELEFQMWNSQASVLIATRARLRDGKTLDAAVLPAVATSQENRRASVSRLKYFENPPEIVDPVEMLNSSLQLEQLRDDFGPALPSGSEVRGGARLFENQAMCPFRAFALHRLRIKPLEEAGIGLDPRQHGTLLHSALEYFWESLGSHDAMMALEQTAFDDQLLMAIERAMEENSIPGELAVLEKTRLLALLREWLVQCEAPRQAFEVVSREQRQSIEHGGIVMTVVLDRMDRVGESLVVVDYKTGTSNKVNTWADKRIVNPQLPLYVLTNEDIDGVSFAQVARNQCMFKGVASDDSLLPKVKTTVNKSRNGEATERALDSWSDWRAHWKEALDNIAAEVRQGLATVTPMATACTYCELKSLCRISDSDSGVDAEEENDGDANGGFGGSVPSSSNGSGAVS